VKVIGGILAAYNLLCCFCQAQIAPVELAHHFAPIHCQYISIKGINSLAGKSDYITSFNFDSDWKAINNWENLERFELPPVVYYSVLSNTTHHFIQYAYFHPRDWTRTPFTKIGQHENDLEGILLIVQRNGTEYGTCVGAIAVFHNQLLLYSTQEFIRFQTKYFRKTPLVMCGNRPVSAQQTKGHGCKAYGDMRHQGQQLALYVPENSFIDRNEINNLPKVLVDTIGYNLVDIFEPGGLWDQRANSDFFATNQSIKGDNGAGAKPPWLWQSVQWKDKYPVGTLAYHPAQIAYDYFSFGNPVDTAYTFNPYQGIK
jgi:hypothetical protein